MSDKDHGYGRLDDGFHLDETWPGLEDKDGVDVHHSAVRNLIKVLEQDVERLSGHQAGTARHLRAYGQVTAGQVGEWDAAQQLTTILGKGHTAITTSYDSLITQYDAAVQAVKTAFRNIGEADHAGDASATGP